MAPSFRNLLTLGLLLITSCTSTPGEDKSILPSDVQLLPGDVVFRQGSGWESKAVMTADRNNCYSHIGIVVDSANIPMIIHAVPDEHDFSDDFDRIKMDHPNTFFLRSRAQIGEIMRVKQLERATVAAQTALRLYHKNIPFDHNYDDTDSTAMYCTELLIYAFRSANIQLTNAPKREIRFPFHFKGYLPSQIHESCELVSIRKF